MHIAQLHRYPIKGLQGEALDNVLLEANQPILYDRFWAIAQENQQQLNGWYPKKHFQQLVNQPSLSLLQACIINKNLCIYHNAEIVCQANLLDSNYQAILQVFLQQYLQDSTIYLHYHEHALADTSAPYISIINTQTMADINNDMAQNSQTNPQKRNMHINQMRGNIIIDDVPAWGERAWLGKQLKIGDCVLEVCEEIERCQAINTNYTTGQHNGNIPQHLRKNYGHIICGLYAKVLQKGSIQKGDFITIL